MLRLRRNDETFRIEILPLIDVIFLLLTFFIYALVLMVRAEVMPMRLQAFESGLAASPRPAVTISITLDGHLWFDREPVTLDEVPGRVEQAKADDPETVIYLALEEGEGDVDRAPILTALWDRLKDADLEINFVGRPSAPR